MFNILQKFAAAIVVCCISHVVSFAIPFSSPDNNGNEIEILATSAEIINNNNGHFTSGMALPMSVCDTIDLGPDTSFCGPGTLQLDAGPGFATYYWSDGQTGQVITVDESIVGGGTHEYFVEATDTLGCGAHDTIYITFNPVPTVDLGSDVSGCLSGSIQLDAGAGMASYLWQDSSTAQTFIADTSTIGTGPQVIWVEVTNIEGCSATDTVIVTFDPSLIVDLGSDVSGCDNSISLLDAGSGFSSYLWNDNSTDQTLEADGSVLGIGTYTYWVETTGELGCVSHDTIDVTVNTSPVIDLGPDISDCEGASITFDAGPGFSKYLWQSASENQIFIADTASIGSGTTTVWVEVTDANGCIAKDEVEVTLDPAYGVQLGSDLEGCKDAVFTLDAGPGFNSYLWSNNVPSQTITVDGSVTGPGTFEYSVDVTSLHGCSSSDTVIVTFRDEPNVDLGSNIISCANELVTLDAGSGFSSYLWSDSSTGQTLEIDGMVTGLGVFTYSVEVTDDLGCTGSDEINVGFVVIPSIDLGADDTSCLDGMFILDPGPGYTSFLWNNNSPDDHMEVKGSEVGAGTFEYWLEVTNATNNCKNRDTILLTFLPGPTVDLGSDITDCEVASITLDAGAGNNTYLWSDSTTGQTFLADTSTIGTGTTEIWVEVTDMDGCMNADTISITFDPMVGVDLGADISTCEGSNTTLDAGQGYVSYLWSDSSTSQTLFVDGTVTGSGTFTYWVEVTTAYGCTSYDTMDVTFVINQGVDLGADLKVCLWATTILDAGPGYTSYLWNNGSTGQTFLIDGADSGAGSFDYSVEVTDIYGCYATDTVSIEFLEAYLLDIGPDHTICMDGSTVLDAGSGYSSYLWSNNSPNQTITIDGSTTGVGTFDYSVIVTNAEGCTASDTVSVIVNANPIVDLGKDDTICADGSLTLDAGANYSGYLWNDGSTDQTLIVDANNSVLGLNNYSVTVTDANGCTGSDDINVLVNPNPVVSIGADQTACEDGSVTFDAGSGYSNYLWSDNTTGQSITVNGNSTGAGTFTYWVKVTDGNGCEAMDSANVTFFANPVVDLGADQQFCEGLTTLLDAGAGFTSYLWNDFTTGQTLFVDGAVTGAGTFTYSVQVTDANGCIGNDEIDVTFFANPIVDLGGPQSVCADAFITLDAGAGFSYAWSDGSNTQTITLDGSVLGAGTYTYSVTVTDNNGCTATDQADITFYQMPTVNLGADQTACADAVVQLDAGTGFNSYLWSNTANGQTLDVNGMDVGAGIHNYSVIITDINGCTATDDVNVEFDSLPVISLGSDVAICESGSVQLFAVGGYTSYLWSDNSNNVTLNLDGSTIGAGSFDYWLEVTNYHGCKGRDTVNVTVHPDAIVDLGADDTTCAYGSFSLNGGNGFTSYLWSDNSTGQVLNVFGTDYGSGTHNIWVKATDANGCTAYDDINLTFTNPPMVSLGLDLVFCQAESVTLDAGSGFASYLWTTGDPTQTYFVDGNVTGSGTFTYAVEVTDDEGCIGFDTINVTFGTAPAVTISGNQNICEGDDLLLDAGAGFATYLWSDATQSRTMLLTGSQPGPVNVSVQVTDAIGCAGSDTVTVTVNANPTVSIGADQSICEGEIANLNAGPGFTSYLWNDILSTTSQTLKVDGSATGAGTFNYSVIVSDGNGCEGTDEALVTVFPKPSLKLDPDTVINGTGSYVIDAGSGYVSYLWNDGTTDQTIVVDPGSQGPGSYQYYVTVVDVNGCQASDTINIEVIVGIDKVADFDLEFFPNPTEGIFHLNISNYSGELTVQIYNTLGQVITSEIYEIQGTLIREYDMRNVARGSYFIRMITGTGDIRTEKIIVQ